MTKKELENIIGVLEQQIAELKEDSKKKDSKKISVGQIWKPEKEERYYNCFDGTIEWEINFFDDLDMKLMDIGNCYPTEEKAEFEAQREKYTRLFRQYVEQHSEPLDWNNDKQIKYFAYYNRFKTQEIQYWQSYVCLSLGVIYASRKEVLKEAIEFVGEENVKKYILEIGE